MEMREYMRRKIGSLSDHLHSAIDLVRKIGQLHDQLIIYGDLQPDHITITNNTVSFINLNKVSQHRYTNSVFEHSYIEHNSISVYSSPEQTGRMNKGIDFRTDIYSIGVIMYELLTQKRPYLSEEPLELVHAILAIQPIPPNQVSSDIPLQLSLIVMKCLEKSVEERYQSAYGLRVDLERCLEQWMIGRSIDTFPLGSSDVSNLLTPSHKIYGREGELARLQAAWITIRSGQPQFLIVHATSGMGKSSLIQHFKSQLLQEGAIFIDGKCEQLNRNRPYDSIIQAFRSYMQVLLIEGEETYWKKKLKDELGSNALIVTELIPEFDFLLDSPSVLPILPPDQYQNRFQHTFLKFLQAFATKEHPFVLFIDDWQWSDQATKKMISLLLSHPLSKYILVIGAYKERLDDLPVADDMNRMAELDSSVNVDAFRLQPLSVEPINRILKDTLNAPHYEDSSLLAKVILERTEGNPFFVHQFIRALYRDKCIVFQSEYGSWSWDLTEVRRYQVTDHVIKLMIDKVQALDGQSLSFLKTAACMGSEFMLTDVSQINGISEKAEELILAKANAEGLVVPGHNRTVNFLHDHIRQSILAMMDEKEKQSIHFRIGMFQFHHSLQSGENRSFEIADHFELAWNFVREHPESNQFASIFLDAGMKSKHAIAYDSALRYLRMGLDLLVDIGWNKSNDVAWNLHMAMAECEYIAGEPEVGYQMIEILKKQAKGVYEKSEVNLLHSSLYRLQGDYINGVYCILNALEHHNFKMKANPSKWDVIKEFLLTKWDILRTKPINLLELHDANDEKVNQIGNILLSLGVSAHFIDRNLLVISMLKMLRVTLKYGNHSASSFAYCDYGIILCSITGDIEQGFRYGEIGIKLSQRYEDSYAKGNAYFIFGAFIQFWRRPLHDNVTTLHEAIRYNEEAGNFVIAGISVSFYVIVRFVKGDPLEQIWNKLDDFSASLGTSVDKLAKSFMTFAYPLLTLLTQAAIPSFDNQETLDVMWMEEKESVLIFRTLQLQILYLFEQYDLAFERMESMREQDHEPLKLLISTEMSFYTALLLAARFDQVDQELQRKYLKRIRKIAATFKKWAEGCADNFQHKYLLIRAEWMRIAGEDAKAAQDYEASIQLAEEHGFIQNVALGNELAARFYSATGKYKLAKWHVIEAHATYLKWGAKSKALHLESKYAEWLSNRPEVREIPIQLIDLDTILKASHMISKEILLENLLRKLMTLLILNTGAHRGVLILADHEELYIEAEGIVDNHGEEHVEVMHATPIGEQPNLPHSIISYVARTKNHVIYHKDGHGMFRNDEYMSRSESKSIVCVPLLLQERMLGMVYLENYSLRLAFSSAQLDMILLLSTQASISIMNAKLYLDLERRVENRTLELEGSKRDLEKALNQLQRSEQARRSLVTNISHDLRTPLQSVLGYTEGLIDGLFSEPGSERKYLNLIHANVKTINRLIEDLFFLSKLESGQARLNKKTTSVIPLMYRLFHKYEPIVLHKEIDFSLHISLEDEGFTYGEEPIEVFIDNDHIDRVVSNLIHNAVRHTPFGGKIQMAVTRQVEYAATEACYVIIMIRNTGSTIHEVELPFIFDRLYKAEKDRFESDGSGLGLSICKEIVESHGGRIWAESDQSNGTSIYFSIPSVQNADSDIHRSPKFSF